MMSRTVGEAVAIAHPCPTVRDITDALEDQP